MSTASTTVFVCVHLIKRGGEWHQPGSRIVIEDPDEAAKLLRAGAIMAPIDFDAIRATRLEKGAPPLNR